MKQITVKVPQQVIDDINKFIPNSKYPTVSEYIRSVIREDLDRRALIHVPPPPYRR